MLRRFLKARKKSTAALDNANALIVKRGARLLQPHQSLLRVTQSSVGVPEAHWSMLYLPVLEAYAELCQQFPASEAHHHAELGGLLRHGLETLHEVLLLRRDLMLPHGAVAEVIAKQQDLWTYAAATAALLHDTGKPITDIRIMVTRPGSGEATPWPLLAHPLPIGSRYSFRFDRQRQYQRHQHIPPLLVSRLIPPVALEWLASEPQVFDQWLAALSGDEAGGQLAAIAAEADRRSAARDLTGGAATQRSPASRVKPLHERLLTTLRHMVAEDKITLNRPGASGFIAEGRLWLVSKRVLDEIREQMTREGQPGVPGRNDRLMDELQQWQILEPNGDLAIWRCQITVGDWTQPLSLICLDAAKIWSNPIEVPTCDSTSVVPLVNEETDESERLSSGSSTPSETASQVHQASSPTAPEILPAETEPEALDDDLPLPFDFPAPSSEAQRDNDDPADEVPPKPIHSFNDPDDLGHRFVRWMIENINHKRVQINTPRARLHVVPEGLLLVTPAIFRDFSPEQWDYAQKRFQKLKLHTKTPEEDMNVWGARVAKDRKQSLIKVILIASPEKQLGVKLPPCNEAISIINRDG